MPHHNKYKASFSFLVLILLSGFILTSHGQNKKNTNFEGVKFDSAINFKRVEFDSAAVFSKAMFYSQVNFSTAIFYSNAYFSGTEFHSPVDFSNAFFKSDVDFTGTKFKSLATFKGTTFHSYTKFSYAQFNSNVSFFDATFDTNVDFFLTKFHSQVDFFAAQFNSSVGFDLATLPDYLCFEYVRKIKNEIDLTYAHLDEHKRTNNKNYRCKINLLNSDISKIKINYEIFKLWFPNYSTYEEKISTYEKLLKKFKDDSFLESYKKLDIEYQDYKNTYNGKIVLNWFLKYWWNYGYDKELVLVWSLCLFLVFSFLNSFLFEYLQRNVFEVNFKFYTKIDSKHSLLKTLKNSALYSINPLIYTAVIFFGIKISLEHFKKFSGWVLYIWLIYIVGLFCLAYIFNIIIVK